jgi:hypothetical protein
MSFTYPSSQINEERSFSSPTGEGIELTAAREVDGIWFDYLLRVVRGERHAHLVAGWAAREGGDMERIRQALDAIDLSLPAGTAPVLSAAEQEAFGLALNQCGLSYFIRKDYQTAALWFQRAF